MVIDCLAHCPAPPDCPGSDVRPFGRSVRTSERPNVRTTVRPFVHAFTLIELLVVISVIIVLAGMMVAVIGALGIGSKKQKSATILETVRQAIEVTTAQTGSVLSPAEHPLAGSFGGPGQPRAKFVRLASPNTALAVNVGALGGAGEAIALKGVALNNLPTAAQARLLLDDDLFADRDLPGLYGMKRDQLFVLGGKLLGVTRYRRLPAPAVTVPPTLIADPDDQSRFPAATNLVASDSGPEANQRTLHYVLGSTNAMSELAKLGALFTPPDDTGLLAFGRVWGDPKIVELKHWKPGMINDPARSGAATQAWRAYRLRGLAVYDAWGVEVLASVSSSGAWRILSAGADGTYRWHPSNDNVLDTDAFATSPAGDDRDGARDNVVSTIGE